MSEESDRTALSRVDCARLLVDEDVATALLDMDVRYVAGRALIVIENQFFDLGTCIAGQCTVASYGSLDYRRRALVRLRYEPSTESSGIVRRKMGASGMAPTLPLPNRTSAADVVLPVRFGKGTYVPFEASAAMRNVSIDAFENAGTILTLSHWPSANTPERYRADLSADSVFRYLDAGEPMPCDCFTSDHFDVDGLVGIIAALSPEWAQRNRGQLLSIAQYGDFNRGHDPLTRRMSLTINALVADRQERAAELQQPVDKTNVELFGEFLTELPSIVGGVGGYEAAWGPEEEVFSRTERLFNEGKISIIVVPEVDLTIFELVEVEAVPTAETNLRYSGLSSISFHNRCESGTLLLVGGERYEVRQRYETWVAKRSAIPRPRRDLALLAEALNELERSTRGWIYDGVQQITPAMRWSATERSSLEQPYVVRTLIDFLRVAPPAWLPLIEGRRVVI
ncbi:DUF6687 family protein [Bradyrhizobium sp. SZCCHNS3002]|uniref:DUF6687 family protein n=1 Tax=Bradyrhizobium sp. SZCCHNS3002 TaxID=3057310 RepID=UPI0028EF6434|nr:DUF6687 family protein [Bradyrhizobium sp. SZCCHNS3002]